VNVYLTMLVLVTLHGETEILGAIQWEHMIENPQKSFLGGCAGGIRNRVFRADNLAETAALAAFLLDNEP